MTQLFINILNWIFSWVNNYGWSVIIFTLFIKLVLLPLDVKSRKSMRAMSLLAPQLEVLKKRYANDQEKLNRKTQELYRSNHVNPLSGCLPILIQMPILFIMFAAMRRVAAQQQAMMMYNWLTSQNLASIVDGKVVLDWAKLDEVTKGIQNLSVNFENTQPWLWIKSVFQADNMSRFVIPTVSELNLTLQQYGEYLTGGELAEAKAVLEAYVSGDGLSVSARLALLEEALSSYNIGDELMQTITAFVQNGGTLEEYNAISASLDSLISSDGALAFVKYVLQPGTLEEGIRSDVLAYLNSMTASTANETLASAKQQISYMLSSNTTGVVFGSQIDTALASTVSSYNDRLLGLISVSFPTKFNRYINGYFILPILACATQILSSKLQPATAPEQPTASKDPKAQQQPGTGKIMKWLFPIMSLFICWTSTAAFAIYWVFVNVWSIVSSYGINFYLSWKDKQDSNKPKAQSSGSNNNNKKEALQP